MPEEHMPEEQTVQSFGQYLRAARLKTGYDLEYVSSETKISPEMLRAIEEEDYGRLPQPVYVMGFIRSFASVVGADADWAVRDYSKNRDLYADLRHSESEYAMRGDSAWPKLLIVVIVAVIVAAAAYFGYSFYRDLFDSGAARTPPVAEKAPDAGKDAEDVSGDLPETDENELQTEIVGDADTSERADADESGGKKEGAAEAKPAAEQAEPSAGPPYELVVEAKENTWMKIIVDGQHTKEYNLKPGERIVVDAESKYNILIGNAGGIRMNLNDKPLPSPGKSGQVVNIVLP